MDFSFQSNIDKFKDFKNITIKNLILIMIRILVRGIPTYFHFCLPCFLSLILYFREYFPVQFIRSLHLYLKAIAITTIITTLLKC